jgi:hypothetical protein
MSNPFKALLKADFIVQWRQRRALFMSLLMPVIFVVSWKSLIPEIGAAGVLSICIAIGLPATGLMGYAINTDLIPYDHYEQAHRAACSDRTHHSRNLFLCILC